ncbi:MAG: AsmA family protein [Desulfurivibrio sp.]|nr:MAG: AsmA family protein [Desulfurivibrio sp.]
MKTSKRGIAWTLLIVALPLLAATGAYLLVDDATLAALIIHRLEQATATRIAYQQDAVITRTLSPTLSVKDLSIENTAGNYQLHTSSLQLQISLPGLLAGRLDVPRLALGDTRVEIRESDSAGSPAFPAPLPFNPVLHDVAVGKLSLMLAGEAVSLPATRISELSIRPSPDTDQPMLSFKTELAGREMQINAALPKLQETLRSRLLPFSLTATGEGIDLAAEGRIDFHPSPAEVKATLHGQTADLGALAAGLKDLNLQGELTAEAQISGTFEQLALENLAASWQGPGQSTAKLSGRLADVTNLAGLELDLTGQVDQAAWLASKLPGNLGTLKNADLSARITGSARKPSLREVKLQVKTVEGLDLQLAGNSDLTANGQTLTPENIDLRLTFAAPATRAARFLLFDQVWELGAINGRADIRSSSGDPALENIVIKTRDPQGIAVELTGGIAGFPLDPHRPNTGYDLEVTMKSAATAIMGERLGVSLPLSGPLAVHYRIEGDTRALQLNGIKLSAGDGTAVQLSARGRVGFGNWDLPDPLAGIDLEVEMQSRDSKSLSAVLGKELPDLGGLSARGRLHTVDGRHRIDDFLATTEKNAPLQASLTGSAQHFTLMPKPAVAGIALSLTATAKDTASLNNLVHRRNLIPSLGPCQATGQISGNDRQIVVSDLSITAGRQDILLVNATGRLGSLSAADNWQPRDTDCHLTAQSSKSRALAKALGYRVPELGPLAAEADLRDKNGKAGLESFRLLVGDKAKPTIDASGFVNDLLAGGGLRLEARLHLDGHTLAAFADNRALPDLHPLVGDLVISDSDGTLGLDSLQLTSNHSDLMSLQLNGQFADFKKLDTLSLDARLTARDLQLLGDLFDRQWPPVGPVTLDSRMKKNNGGTAFDFDLTAGQTTAHSAITVLFDRKPPQINGAITARNFSLPQPPDKAPENTGKKKPAATPIFSRKPIDLHWLQRADGNLTVDILSFDRERFKIESARLTLINQAGRLTISPARLVYPQGELNFALQLDGQGTPRVEFTALGTDINPWKTFGPPGAKPARDFEADLDVDVNLTSTGTSAHELAANLAGKIFLTVINGKIRKQLLDLVFVDLIGWSASKVMGEKYTDLDCGVADFRVKDGILSTNALFLDSKNIAIAGQGDIDLGDEQLDYVFLPRKKSRLIHRADPVKVQGPLRDPAVKVIPWKSAATTYGGLFFAPYIFAGMVAADWVSDALNIQVKKSPCQEYMREHEKSRETQEGKSIP